MIRNLVKFSTTPKIRSSHFIFGHKTCNLYWLKVPSVCSYQQNKFICSNPVQNTLLRPSSCYGIKDYVRFKSKDQKSRVRQDDSDSEEESEDEESGYDKDGNKLRLIKLKSMRVDNILGKCLGLSRRKIEDLFLETKFRFNGQPLPKKSVELKGGDTLEVCSDPVDTGGTTEVVQKLNIIKVKTLDDLSYYTVTYSVEKRK